MNGEIDTEYIHRIEAACIGALVLVPCTLDDVPWLRPKDFAYAHFGQWFSLIRERHEAGEPVDLVTLYVELRHRDELGPGHAWMRDLSTLTDNVPLPGYPVPYAQAVVEESIRRQVESIGTRIVQLSQVGDPALMLAEVARQDRVIGEAQVRWATVAGAASCSPREALKLDSDRSAANELVNRPESRSSPAIAAIEM